MSIACLRKLWEEAFIKKSTDWFVFEKSLVDSPFFISTSGFLVK